MAITGCTFVITPGYTVLRMIPMVQYMPKYCWMQVENTIICWQVRQTIHLIFWDVPFCVVSDDPWEMSSRRPRLDYRSLTTINPKSNVIFGRDMWVKLSSISIHVRQKCCRRHVCEESSFTWWRWRSIGPVSEVLDLSNTMNPQSVNHCQPPREPATEILNLPDLSWF